MEAYQNNYANTTGDVTLILIPFLHYLDVAGMDLILKKSTRITLEISQSKEYLKKQGKNLNKFF